MRVSSIQVTLIYKFFKVKSLLTDSRVPWFLHRSENTLMRRTSCASLRYTAHSQRSNKIVVALYNYTARESTDVSFMKGDRMEVLDDSEPDWWRVLHLTTLQEGLIPWNFVAVERSVESEE